MPHLLNLIVDVNASGMSCPSNHDCRFRHGMLHVRHFSVRFPPFYSQIIWS